MRQHKYRFLFLLAMVMGILPAWAGTVRENSVYQQKPEDPEALFFTPEQFSIKADGKSDVSDALQEALNQVKREKSFGILFIPEGKYRISRTIYIPPAVRMIGYGGKRPVFILGKNTPGFQAEVPGDKGKANYMFWFTGNMVGAGDTPRDAGAGTFYSAISNIDFTIEEGNPHAVVLRTHFAQHGFISHSVMNIGKGKAGIFDVGNELENVKFIGGEYGIYTYRTSPGWPMMIADTWFENQRKAAILTYDAGLAIVKMQVKNVPVVVEMGDSKPDRLYMEECLFENVTEAAIKISMEGNTFTQVNLQNIDCHKVPVLASFHKSGNKVMGLEKSYRVRDFTYGLVMEDLVADSRVETITDLVPIDKVPAVLTPGIPALPPMEEWVNIRQLGAVGDGDNDDTPVFREALEKYKTIYVPQGWYRITGTLKMRPGTRIIGLHPFATQFVLKESEPAFSGFGAPVAMVESSAGGDDQFNGIGLSTGGYNYRAVGCKWMAGEKSLLNDVKFVGGHGTMRKPAPPTADVPAAAQDATAQRAAGQGVSGLGAPVPGAAAQAAAGQGTTGQQVAGQGTAGQRAGMARLQGRGPAISSPTSPVSAQGMDLAWDNQYWSLWVTNNGGGILKDIWTANTYAASGLYVSNTSTPGRIYAMSLEHHVRNEARFENVQNWKIMAFQFEEEGREGKECQMMEISGCRDLLFANLWMYRVIRVTTPQPYGIKVRNSENIEFRNLHSYTQVLQVIEFPVYEANKELPVYPWDFARLTVTGRENGKLKLPVTPGKMEKLAGGFNFTTGATSDSKGNVYFCETRLKKIYQWNAASNSLRLLADYPYKPLTLATDTKDNLLVVFRYDPQPGLLVNGVQERVKVLPDDNPMYSGWGNGGWAAWAYSVDPENPDETIKLLPRVANSAIPKVEKVYHPSSRWRYDFNDIVVSMPDSSFVAPDGVTIIPETYDIYRSTTLTPTAPGKKFFVADEDVKRTVELTVDEKGKAGNLKEVHARGEYTSVVDKEGNLYLADGQIFVFDPSGREIKRISIEERPISMTIGGKEGNTLFVTTRTALWGMQIK